MRRIILVLSVAALMVAMIAGPAKADIFHNDGRFHQELFDNNGFFNDNGLFDNNVDTIDVGPLECVVEDGDDVDFCVNEDTGQIVNV